MVEREDLLHETQAMAPRVLPFNWKRLDDFEGLVVYQGRAGLRVFLSVMRERDGKRWLHVSFSRREKIPNWDDVRAVKDLFIGKDEEALQVFPPQDEYVNVHPRTLHLWHCIDGRLTPDFREGGMI